MIAMNYKRLKLMELAKIAHLIQEKLGMEEHVVLKHVLQGKSYWMMEHVNYVKSTFIRILLTTKSALKRLVNQRRKSQWMLYVSNAKIIPNQYKTNGIANLINAPKDKNC